MRRAAQIDIQRFVQSADGMLPLRRVDTIVNFTVVKEIPLKKSIIASTLVLIGAIASPSLLHAQDNQNSGYAESTSVGDQNDNGNWGWLGLLGLAGLLGLKRSDREKMHDQGRSHASI